MKLTPTQRRVIINNFKWCLSQAEELFGVHTGGPHEMAYRTMLSMCEISLKELVAWDRAKKQKKKKK